MDLIDTGVSTLCVVQLFESTLDYNTAEDRCFEEFLGAELCTPRQWRTAACLFDLLPHDDGKVSTWVQARISGTEALVAVSCATPEESMFPSFLSARHDAACCAEWMNY